MMKVTDSGHAARLQRLTSPALIEALGRALLASAASIAVDAAESIRADSISGPGHIPSLPGQPPNADTHDLDSSIHVGDLVEVSNAIQTHVIADSDHAWIELGGARMKPRPYMGPAMIRGRQETLERLASTYNRYVREK